MPSLRFRSFATTVGVTSLVVTGLIASLRLLGIFEAGELRAYDRFLRLRKPAPTDERILVVGIDEEDIQELQQYPLYDGTLATALNKLEAQNPRVIGVDIGRDVPQGLAEGRRRLLQTIGASDRIIMACLLSHPKEPGLAPPPNTPEGNVAFADLPQDPDGVFRRTTLVSTPAPPPPGTLAKHVCNDPSEGNQMLSLGFLTSMIYLEAEGITPTSANENGGIELDSVVLNPLGERAGGYANTGATDFQIMLNYRAPREAVREVSLRAVLQDQVKADWVEDRIVLIGYTSHVAKDIVRTPYLETEEGQRGMAGVVVHAQAASQLLSAVLDNRPLMTVWPEPLEVLWIGLWALGAGALTFYSRQLAWFALLSGILVTACMAVAYLCFGQGLWIPLIPCLWVMVVMAAIVGLLDRANRGGYTQAIFEQLQEQLQGKNARGSDRSDYLMGLVQRARAVRLNRSGQEVDPATLAVDPLNLQFESPEMQRIYDAMRSKVEQEARQQASHTNGSNPSHQSTVVQQRLGRLINRAQAARSHPADHHEHKLYKQKSHSEADDLPETNGAALHHDRDIQGGEI